MLKRVGGSAVKRAGGAGVKRSAATTRALLTSSDLTYQGIFLPPVDNGTDIRFAYSIGAMACRRVGDAIHIFMTGANTASGAATDDRLYEFTYPGSASLTATFPRGTMVRKWLHDPYKNASSTELRAGSGGITPQVRGLLWYDDKLWWSWGHYYSGSAFHTRSLGFTEFNDGAGTCVGYGSWRTDEHSQQT